MHHQCLELPHNHEASTTYEPRGDSSSSSSSSCWSHQFQAIQSCPLAPSHTAKRATIGGRGGEGGGREGMAPRQIRSNTPPSWFFLFRGTPAGECVHFPPLSLSRKKNYNIRVKIMRFHPPSFFLHRLMAAKTMSLMAHRIA